MGTGFALLLCMLATIYPMVNLIMGSYDKEK